MSTQARSYAIIQIQGDAVLNAREVVLLYQQAVEKINSKEIALDENQRYKILLLPGQYDFEEQLFLTHPKIDIEGLSRDHDSIIVSSTHPSPFVFDGNVEVKISNMTIKADSALMNTNNAKKVSFKNVFFTFGTFEIPKSDKIVECEFILCKFVGNSVRIFEKAIGKNTSFLTINNCVFNVEEDFSIIAESDVNVSCKVSNVIIWAAGNVKAFSCSGIYNGISINLTGKKQDVSLFNKATSINVEKVVVMTAASSSGCKVSIIDGCLQSIISDLTINVNGEVKMANTKCSETEIKNIKVNCKTFNGFSSNVEQSIIENFGVAASSIIAFSNCKNVQIKNVNLSAEADLHFATKIHKSEIYDVKLVGNMVLSLTDSRENNVKNFDVKAATNFIGFHSEKNAKNIGSRYFNCTIKANSLVCFIEDTISQFVSCEFRSEEISRVDVVACRFSYCKFLNVCFGWFDGEMLHSTCEANGEKPLFETVTGTLIFNYFFNGHKDIIGTIEENNKVYNNVFYLKKENSGIS